MRVLYFHQYFITPEGAGGTRSYEFAQYLIEQGHKVTMVYIRSAGAAAHIDTPFKNGVRRGHFRGIDLIEFDIVYSNRHNLLRRSYSFLKYALRSSLLAFTEPYDLLFATSTPLTAGIPGVLMKWLSFKKRPFVFEVRDLWPEIPKAMGIITNPVLLWLMGLLELVTYRAADACIGLSAGMQAGIKKRLRKKKPVVLIPNGCDLDLFRPLDETVKVGEGAKKPITALFAGAHGYANGLEKVLDVALILKKKGYSEAVNFLFVGDGIKKDELVKRATEEALNNCTFLELLPKKELAILMPKMDVGLMVLADVPAFYYGTSPNKFFDYISSGLPIINNYPGWLQEMIKKNKCGLSVEPMDSDSFASALVYLYENPSARKMMAQNSRKLAVEQFKREKLAADFEATLTSVFDAHG